MRSKEICVSKFDLATLGWNADLASQLTAGLQPARVVAGHRGEVDIATEEGRVRVAVPRRFARAGQDVAVGDWVGIATGAVQEVLPRRSALIRHAAGKATRAQVVAANVDIVFVVTSVGPDLDLRRLERYLVTIWESGARPELILSKIDRVDDATAFAREVATVAPDVPVHTVSAVTGEGCDAVLARITRGTTAVLVGSSGVGTSTLLNRLAGADVMSTGEVRLDDDEGRHTTTHRELILLPNGGILIDTPGIRELQLWSAEEGLEAAFSDIESLVATCRFSDCSHESEPGCAVQAAIADGTLTEQRYASWRKLQAELQVIAARQDALVARDEKRKWKLLSADEKTRTRNR